MAARDGAVVRALASRVVRVQFRVEFVVGSEPRSEVCSPSSPVSSFHKNSPNSDSTRREDPHENLMWPPL